MELRIVEAPKSPLSIGRSGWLIFEFRVAIPRKPASMKISIVSNFSFSLEIKNIEIKIRIQDIILWTIGEIVGRAK